MKKIMTRLKSIRLDRILTVFFASILLFVSTACGSSKVLAKTADEVREEVPSRAVTNTYKGGMNDYSDVDPRRDTSEAKAKAKALIENAQKNINEKSINSPGELGQNIKEGPSAGVRRIGEDIGKSAEDVAEGVSKGTQKGVENIKENTQKAPEYFKKVAKETATNGENIGDKIQDAARNTADAIKGKVNRDIGRTQQALEDASDAID